MAQSTPPSQSSSSILTSLSRLGIRVARTQLIGLIVSVITGMVVARLLPFIYPLIFSRPLDIVFGPGASSFRDGFNSLLMTTCTFMASFLVAFVVVLAFGRRKRAA